MKEKICFVKKMTITTFNIFFEFLNESILQFIPLRNNVFFHLFIYFVWERNMTDILDLL